jgi:hypothetical protein
MKKMSGKEITLAVLVIGIGVVLYIQYQRGAFSPDAERATGPGHVKEVTSEQLPKLVEVKLEMNSGSEIRPHSRNLFNYAESPAEIAEKLRQQREAERLAKEAAERRRLQMEEEAKAAAARAEAERVNPPPPPPPTISFRFIGKMGDARAPIAILADPASGDVFTAKEGEVVMEKFKVKKIEFDSVTIGYTDALIAAHPDWGQQTKVIRMGT